MKAITAIYMHLRPDLFEDYVGGETEMDTEEAMVCNYPPFFLCF